MPTRNLQDRGFPKTQTSVVNSFAEAERTSCQSNREINDTVKCSVHATMMESQRSLKSASLLDISVFRNANPRKSLPPSQLIFITLPYAFESQFPKPLLDCTAHFRVKYEQP